MFDKIFKILIAVICAYGLFFLYGIKENGKNGRYNFEEKTERQGVVYVLDTKTGEVTQLSTK